MSAIPRYCGEDRKALQKILRDAGFRSTEGRLALLSALKHSSKPLPVELFVEKVGTGLDYTNVYRALESFTEKGITRRIDLQHGHAHYEFNDGHDHHHIVCTSCDKVEDFTGCEYENLVSKALKQTPAFSRVTSHSLELFGLCNTCVKIA